jgi:hypothetical protein
VDNTWATTSTIFIRPTPSPHLTLHSSLALPAAYYRRHTLVFFTEVVL